MTNITFDESNARKALEWIDATLQEDASVNKENVSARSVQQVLQDGIVLCRLINRIQPGSVNHIQRGIYSFQKIENLNSFLSACRRYGVPENKLFYAVDAFKERRIGLVVNGVIALSDTVEDQQRRTGMN